MATRRYFSSTAQRTTITSSIINSDTTIPIAAATGLPSSYPYTMILDPDTTSEEIIEVTARASLNLTVTRGVDGTTAVSHSSGAYIQHGFSARDFEDANAHVMGYMVTNAQTGTTYTFAAGDQSKRVTFSNASPVTATVPNSVFSQGDSIPVLNKGVGVLTVVAGSGVTLTASDGATLNQGQGGLIVFDSASTAYFTRGGIPKALVSGTTGSPATNSYSASGISYSTYKWTANGTVTLSTGGLVDILLVGGGGAGGYVSAAYGGPNSGSGGGGGGQVLALSNVYLAAGTYTVTVGAGGTATTTADSQKNAMGGQSVLGPYIAIGGGCGGAADYYGQSYAGKSGGNGGGSVQSAPGGISLTGTGYAGGLASANYWGSGGGGAGATGGTPNGSSPYGGTGGNGVTNNWETGSNQTYGGGGGGGAYFSSPSDGGSGGTGGGGHGGGYGNANITAGTANTGGGGGGAATAEGTGVAYTGANGGSGVVVLRIAA